MDGNTIVLTTGNSQTSAVFHPHPVDQSDTFSCTVTFRLTSPPRAGEADGIGIVFVPKKALGLGGYGMGYSGLGGKGDFAVEGELLFLSLFMQHNQVLGANLLHL